MLILYPLSFGSYSNLDFWVPPSAVSGQSIWWQDLFFVLNLQWHNVTNTIWWQDFPRRKVPDCTTLFPLFKGNANKVLKSDFAAQLAGFMAILVSDVPNEAYWIAELSKYSFSGADGYLVASVPGIHSHRSLSATPPVSSSQLHVDCGHDRTLLTE